MIASSSTPFRVLVGLWLVVSMAGTALAQTYTISQGTSSLSTLTAPNVVAPADDQTIGPFNIGFDFNFFGVDYGQFYISSNGFIAFENTSNGCCSGQFLPNTGQPNNMIAAYYEDFDPPEGGQISYSLEGGVVGARTLVVEFNGIYPWNGPPKTPSTWQIKLRECTNVIEVHCESCVDDGGAFTQGIENAAGDEAYFVAGRNSQTFSLANDLVVFDPGLVTCAPAFRPEAVPSMNAFGVMLMMLSLMMIGGFAIRRSSL
ncbi:hypothetical protein [Wenzhouxiangella marina]|uniref:Uncharacterized protein n=1 Tax=Wenzhouxiangella marina TaxID=1579979 RepID=A0A0K0XZ27_9GAMM|nr:hypothetical protein [Wenzhouxiangella marina]AKS42876.1 hypothetical protein WM2015_2518 [Wenzhouxiangella marina]MBB6087442.1 hypothetical protein [Wenzhouxiangella marina]